MTAQMKTPGAVAVRWECTAAQIVVWSIADEIDLVATFAPVMIGDEEIGGLMSVAGSEIRPLFRSVGGAAKKVCVRLVRPQFHDEWKLIQTSDNGDTPDESTIRRRIRAVWQELHPE